MRTKLFFTLMMGILFVLSGCAVEKIPTSSTPAGTSSTAPSTKEVQDLTTQTVDEALENPSMPLNLDEEELKGTPIQFWHSWTGETASVIEALTEVFNQENSYDITVVVESKGSRLFDDVRQGLNSGQFPTLVLATTQDLLSWQNTREILVDLRPYVEDSTLGFHEDEVDDFQPILWKQDVFNGVRLGIPSHAVSTLLAYNLSWAQELGFVAPPAIPAGFTDQVCSAAAVSVGDPDVLGKGGYITNLDASSMISWITAFGGQVAMEAGERYTFNSQDVLEAFDYVNVLFKRGCAWNPDLPYAEDEFAARKGLVYATTITELPYIANAFSKNESADEWTVLSYPSKEGIGVIDVIPYSFAIMDSASEAQVAAWLYLKWMITPGNQAAIVKASSTYPARLSAMAYLDTYAMDHPQWKTAQSLFPYGSIEPRLSSWKWGRWVVEDAVGEMISMNYSSEEIPNLLMKIDTLLAEIHNQTP